MRTAFISCCMALLCFAPLLRGQDYSQQLRPPAQGLTIPYDELSFDHSECTTYTFASGTMISVPEYAFVDENGQRFEGAVLLRYRELHDPADFIAVGMPLSIIVNGKNETLESAGMFEVAAFHEGKQVQLAPGKSIAIRFASRTALTDDVALYYLDPSKGWQKLGEKPIKEISPNPEVAAEAEDDVWGDGGFGEDDFGWSGGGWEGDDFYEDDLREDEDYASILDNETELFREVEIDRMGWYNYDELLKFNETVTLDARFAFSSGFDKEKAIVYIVYAGLNSYVAYPLDEDAGANIALMEGRPCAILAILPDQQIALFPPEEYAKLNIRALDGTDHTFTMTTYPRKAVDAASIRQVLLSYGL